MQILGSKGRLAVKLKDCIFGEKCLKLGLKATGIFVVSLDKDGFENQCPERKLQTITS